MHGAVTNTIRIEVETPPELIIFQRNVGQNPAEFASRFMGAVAKYVNLTSPMESITEQRFAVRLLRSANVSLDAMNAHLYQLSMSALIGNKYMTMNETNCTLNFTKA